MKKKTMIQKLTKKVNLMGDIQKLCKNKQKIIMVLGGFESKGEIPTYEVIGTYLGHVSKAYVCKLMKELRNSNIVLPKINKLDSIGKEMLTKLRVGLGLGDLRTHKLAIKCQVESVQRPFKHGQLFMTGRKKRIMARKQIIGKRWHGTLFMGKKKSMYIYLDCIFSQNMKHYQAQVTNELLRLKEELLYLGIDISTTELIEEEFASMGHPFAEWYYKHFGIGGTDKLWIDQSMGIPELETSDPDLMEAIELVFGEMFKLAANQQEKLTKTQKG